jgi:hypothetical protein
MILENPDNIVFEYVCHNPQYKKPLNSVGNQELEIFIVDIVQEKIINIINTHDDLNYFWDQLEDSVIENKIKNALSSYSYQIENCNINHHYQLVAIASGIYYSYPIKSPSIENVRFLESEPWKYFK